MTTNICFDLKDRPSTLFLRNLYKFVYFSNTKIKNKKSNHVLFFAHDLELLHKFVRQ